MLEQQFGLKLSNNSNGPFKRLSGLTEELVRRRSQLYVEQGLGDEVRSWCFVYEAKVTEQRDNVHVLVHYTVHTCTATKVHKRVVSVVV